MVLVGGRLHALAHGVRQKKVAHFGLGVAADAAVWGVDVVEGTLLDAGGQWCGKAASLALGGSGAVSLGGASGSGGNSVDHEGAVFVGGPGCLGTGVEARFIGRNETLDLVLYLKTKGKGAGSRCRKQQEAQKGEKGHNCWK